MLLAYCSKTELPYTEDQSTLAHFYRADLFSRVLLPRVRLGRSVDNLLLTRRLSDFGYGSQPNLLVRNCKASVCLGMNLCLTKVVRHINAASYMLLTHP